MKRTGIFALSILLLIFIVIVNYFSTFNPLKTASNYCLWIDDDGENESLQFVDSICNAKGIKCSFAIIYPNLTDSCYKSKIDSLHINGYDILCHCNHGEMWRDISHNEDYVLNDIDNCGHLCNNYKYEKMVVYPFGQFNDNISAKALEYFDVGIIGRNKSIFNKSDFLLGRHIISLYMNKIELYLFINYCAITNRLLIIGTHSKNKEEQKDIIKWLDYILSSGFTFIDSHDLLKVKEGNK